MQFFKLFSERQEELRGEVPDVYQYETIPQELRVQVIHIWHAAFGKVEHGPLGDPRPSNIARVYEEIHKTLAFHYGVVSLGGSSRSDFIPVCEFFLKTEVTEKAIDVIESLF